MTTQDEAAELAAAHAAHEMSRAYARALGHEVRAWDDVSQAEVEHLRKLVAFVLAGGTAESMHELRRQRLVEAGMGGEALAQPWEKLPLTQQKRDILMVAAIDAMAMALGHSRRPVTQTVRVELGQGG